MRFNSLSFSVLVTLAFFIQGAKVSVSAQTAPSNQIVLAQQEVQMAMDCSDKNTQGLEHRIHHLTKAIELAPNYEEAYSNRAKSYETLRKYDLAVQDYTKLIQLKPQKPYYFRHRAVNYIYFKKYDLARQDLDKYLQGFKEEADYLKLRAWLYFQQKKYDLAIEDYTRAMALGDDLLHFHRGRSYFEKGNYDLALKDFDESVIKNANLHNYRGLIYTKKQRYEFALQEFNKAIEIATKEMPYKLEQVFSDDFFEEFSKYYYNRGLIYQKLGENELAEKDFNSSKSLASNK